MKKTKPQKYERKDDLSRGWCIDVYASGHVTVRRSGTRLTPGALPVFSTHTEDHALMLVVRHCRKIPREDSYILNDPPKSVDDLEGVSDMFRASYDRMFPATSTFADLDTDVSRRSVRRATGSKANAR